MSEKENNKVSFNSLGAFCAPIPRRGVAPCKGVKMLVAVGGKAVCARVHAPQRGRGRNA